MRLKIITVGIVILILCLTCEGPDIAVDSEGKIIEQQEELSCACRVNGDVQESGDGQSWDTAMKTVEECVNVIESEPADSGCEIWVKRGTVVEGYDFDSTKLDAVELRPDIRAFGGFKGTEITKNERIWNAVRAISKSDMDRDTFSERQRLFNSYVQSHPEFLDDFHHSMVPSPGNLPGELVDVPDPELLGLFTFPCLCDRFWGYRNEDGGTLKLRSWWSVQVGQFPTLFSSIMDLSGYQIDTDPQRLILNGLTENGVTVVGPYNDGNDGALVVRRYQDSETKLYMDNKAIDTNFDRLFLNWYSQNDVIITHPAGGRVGIGTDFPSPGVKIHILGNESSSDLSQSSLKISNDGQHMYLDGNEIDSDDILALNWNSSEDVILAHGGGNVCVGDITKSKCAGFSSLFTVDGKLKAETIVVDKVYGADFVFKKDYNLMSIQKVENFIAKNGHLPGVPSADKMESQELDISKMQSLLLQKIEELTLYTIEQEKEIKRLRRKLSKIEKDIN